VPGTTVANLKEKRDEILTIARKHGASNIRVFGSVARGEADEQSDIDFLIDLAPGRTLFDLGGLAEELRELLGRKVDVVIEAGLRDQVRQRLLREALPL